MENTPIKDKKDNQPPPNYVTVIPIDYRKGALYNIQNTDDYLVEHLAEYSQRNRDDYHDSEDLSTNQGPLYSVSQRIPTVSTSYSSLCTTTDAGFSSEQTNFSGMQEWDRQGGPSGDSKDSNSDVFNDKQINDSNTTASVPSSLASAGGNTNNTFEQGLTTQIAIYMHNHIVLMMEIEDPPSATTELLCQAIVNCDELAFNKSLALQVFTLWMISPLLALQLKPSHKPFEIRQNWKNLINQFSHASYNRQVKDEPKIIFQRNIFFPQYLEEKIKDQKILELLYEEACSNILDGHYPCDVTHYIMLGGIQARIELGSNNPQIHTVHYFREEQSKYLPIHIRKNSPWTWLPLSTKNSAEVRLLEQFKRIPNPATNRKLIKKYLEFCWSLPFYGAAFFEGQIEQPVRGLISLMTHQDIPVLVAINSKGIYIIDDLDCSLLLGLKFEELSWEYARPSQEKDPNCLPCLFLQFMIVENGVRVSKILQVFSRQASLMDTLISCFVEQIKLKKANDELDKTFENQMNSDNDTHSSSLHMDISNIPSLTNKLNKLTLATFDESGHCIGQMGSWSFSY